MFLKFEVLKSEYLLVVGEHPHNSVRHIAANYEGVPPPETMLDGQSKTKFRYSPSLVYEEDAIVFE